MVNVKEIETNKLRDKKGEGNSHCSPSGNKDAICIQGLTNNKPE